MKKLSSIIATICFLFVFQSFSQNTTWSKGYTEQTAILVVFEIEKQQKTILVGGGLSPLYWRFRVPDSKWAKVSEVLAEEDQVCLTWVGPELSDPASLVTSDDYNGLCVLRGITVFKPVKLF